MVFFLQIVFQSSFVPLYDVIAKQYAILIFFSFFFGLFCPSSLQFFFANIFEIEHAKIKYFWDAKVLIICIILSLYIFLYFLKNFDFVSKTFMFFRYFKDKLFTFILLICDKECLSLSAFAQSITNNVLLLQNLARQTFGDLLIATVQDLVVFAGRFI